MTDRPVSPEPAPRFYCGCGEPLNENDVAFGTCGACGAPVAAEAAPPRATTPEPMTLRVPPPGSWLAGALGCLCPVMDNGHGRGYLGGVRDGWGHVLYVVSGACPMHGGEHNAAYLPLAACARPRAARLPGANRE